MQSGICQEEGRGKKLVEQLLLQNPGTRDKGVTAEERQED
jgi:hypothetical protein